MRIIKLTNEDIEYLKNDFPSLTYNEDKNLITGFLPFESKFGEDGYKISDKYQIEIDLNNVCDLGMPIVRETAQRIIRAAYIRNIAPIDLHIYEPDGEMCIIIPPKIIEKYPNGFDLQKLIVHIQDHLYWISYFLIFNKPPWKDYAHGELGYLQLYLENKEKYSLEIKNHFECKSRPVFRRKIKELLKKYKIEQ